MPTSYTTNLGLALPADNELDGTWGGVVNTEITQLIEDAVAGLVTINTWTANSHTLTTADGASSEARNAILKLTDTGTALTGAGTVIAPTTTKTYIVLNETGQSITVKTSAGTGPTIADNGFSLIVCDGTNIVTGDSQQTAAQTPFTPTGTVAATDVQAAIAEVDTEKAPIAGPTFTGTVTIPTADINGGTIDGTVIGGTTPAAGTFTTATAANVVIEAAVPNLGSIRRAAGVIASGTLLLDIPITGSASGGVAGEGARIRFPAVKEWALGDTPVDIAFDTTNEFFDTASEKMRITSEGYVGINETSPDRHLHINIGTENTGIKIESTDAGAYIEFEDDSTTVPPTIGAVGDAMQTFVGGTQRFNVIDTGASVGGGTPAERLDVNNGAIRVANNKTPATATDGAAYFHKEAGYAVVQSDIGVRLSDSGSSVMDATTDAVILNTGIREDVSALATSGSIALDVSNGNAQTIAMSGAVTLTDSLSSGDYITLVITSEGGDGVTFPAGTKWRGGAAPTWDATEDNIVVINKIGSTLYASYVGAFS